MIFKRLVKVPKHKQFTYEPRHFNPEQEERQERHRRIEAQVKAEKEGIQVSKENYSYRISQAFRNQRTQPKSIFDISSSVMLTRLLIIFILVGGVYAWLEYGNSMFSAFLDRRNILILIVLSVGYFLYKKGIFHRSS